MLQVEAHGYFTALSVVFIYLHFYTVSSVLNVHDMVVVDTAMTLHVFMLTHAINKL